jgi:hypothetical protein
MSHKLGLQSRVPDGAAVALIIRGNALVPPVPGAALQAGDHVHFIAQPEDRARFDCRKTCGSPSPMRHNSDTNHTARGRSACISFDVRQ